MNLLLFLLFLLYFCIHQNTSYSHARFTQIKTGILNLRGGDFHYLPVFFAYAIITEKDCFLYLKDHERAINNKIDNHFLEELIDVAIREYNETLTGINSVVSYVYIL